jgi:3-hydroxy acid dehydrogenase/malonic semialdehyde reductase
MASQVLKDRTVLITGASQGIGRSIALAFAKQSPATFILFSRSTERLSAVASELSKIDSKIQVIIQSVDVASPDSIQKALSAALSKANQSRIDVLVNNAGIAIGAPRSFPELTIDEINTMLSTNVNGYMYVTHAVLNAGGMFKAKRGTILNITSVTGLEVPPFPGEAVYHTSKAAQEAFTNVLRTELQCTNIKVLALRPGIVANTNFHELRVGHEKGKDLYDEFMKGIQPLEPDDIAEAAVYMLSQPEAVSVKALDVIPSSQRSLASFDRTWNERNGKEDVKMGR